MRSRFSDTIEMWWPGSQILGGWSEIFPLGLIITEYHNRPRVHTVFIYALVNPTNESKSSSPWSMIVRAVSAETLIMTQKYVLMIATAAIFNYLVRVYCSLHAFSSRDAKRNERNAFRAYIQRIFNSRLLFWPQRFPFGRNGGYSIQ